MLEAGAQAPNSIEESRWRRGFSRSTSWQMGGVAHLPARVHWRLKQSNFYHQPCVEAV